MIIKKRNLWELYQLYTNRVGSNALTNSHQQLPGEVLIEAVDKKKRQQELILWIPRTMFVFFLRIKNTELWTNYVTKKKKKKKKFGKAHV